MIRVHKRHYVMNIYLAFLLCMALISGLFAVRVAEAGEVTPFSVGQTILTAETYTFGTVSDRNGEGIVFGEDGEIRWCDDLAKAAFDPVFGTDITSTLGDRTTLLGNCSWVYGTDDNRLSVYHLLHPQAARIGGEVKTTFDIDLQEFIYLSVQELGYENAYVVVSNYKTGEILAVYGDVLRAALHPGSSIKPILAAAILTMDPMLLEYTYNCIEDNHYFETSDGTIKIKCAGNAAHGLMDMEDGLAYSCNGYFISLVQQVDQAALQEALGRWGFDQVVSYSQFMYWDHSFIKGSEADTDYLMAAIGQANAYITPAGMNFCTNAILNHGEMQEPHWYTQKKSSPQAEWTDVEIGEPNNVCDSDAADMVKEMMLSVTEKGTGRSFYLPGFAAKTGTAQKSDGNGNLTGFYTVWTTGGLTDDSTPYSITVCLDNVTGETGGSAAGKLARDILTEITEGGGQR